MNLQLFDAQGRWRNPQSYAAEENADLAALSPENLALYRTIEQAAANVAHAQAEHERTDETLRAAVKLRTEAEKKLAASKPKVTFMDARRAWLASQ
jgi:hypothetical protein